MSADESSGTARDHGMDYCAMVGKDMATPAPTGMQKIRVRFMFVMCSMR